jgi:hypothetical protein
MFKNWRRLMKHLLALFLVTFFLWVVIGCSEEPCNTVGDERCEGNMIERCISGVWRDWDDCAADNQECYTDENDTVSCVPVSQTCDDVCVE